MPLLTPRPATPADQAAVEALLADSDLPVAGIAELLAGRPDDFLVVDDPTRPGALAAVAGLEVCDGGDGQAASALLRSVAVHPAWRAHGLGGALVRALVDAAAARGLAALYLLTTTADAYFPRFGFARVAREAVPAAVRGTLEFTSACPASAVAMAKPLTAEVRP